MRARGVGESCCALVLARSSDCTHDSSDCTQQHAEAHALACIMHARYIHARPAPTTLAISAFLELDMLTSL